MRLVLLWEPDQVLMFCWPPAQLNYWWIRGGRGLLAAHLKDARQCDMSGCLFVGCIRMSEYIFLCTCLWQCNGLPVLPGKLPDIWSWNVCMWKGLCRKNVCVRVRVFKCVALYCQGGTHEVTVAYVIHAMPHRSSWNQLLIIVPDRLVHTQRTATGAGIPWISTENCQNRIFFFFFTCDILDTWRHAKMNGRYSIWHSGIHLHGWICFMLALSCSFGLGGKWRWNW